MPSYQRKAASLDELRMQVLLAYGPEARIVDATRVSRRGLGRFFAREEVEATIKVPEHAAPAGGVAPERIDRVGIAALLAEADRADGPGRADGATASRNAFDEMLAEVERSLGSGPGPGRGGGAGAAGAGAAGPAASGPPAASAPPAPSIPPNLLALPAASAPGSAPAPDLPTVASAPSPGDLVLVVGLGDDARIAAEGLAGATQGVEFEVRTGPPLDRREALAARVDAVESGRALLFACEAGLDEEFGRFAALRADEVWAAVDVSRRADDTADWLSALDVGAALHALALVGFDRTRSPLDAALFGVPIGWRDDAER